MDASPSPQLMAVGEDSSAKNPVPKEVAKQSYASTLQNKQSALSKTELCPIFKEHGEPVIQFTREEVDNFIMEEGLHQAAVLMFSYSRPNLSEVRKFFSSQFEVQGHCNIGQLEFHHILIRFDLYNDYVHFLSKSAGFLKSKGDEFFFRTFPWTLNFNPKEETSMAVVWISLPGLPPNFFARRSLLSIASAVGKPLAIDKATQDRTRPSAARVKIIVDLLANHPKTVKLQILDKVCGKTVDFHQEIVFDNMPKYCVFCKHQGYDEKACRIKKSQAVAEVQAEEKKSSDLLGSELGCLDKLQGDAREFLNAKRSGQGIKELQERKVYKQLWNVKVGQARSAEKLDNIEKETGSDPNGISVVNPADANVHVLVKAAVSNVNTNQCGSDINIENLIQVSQTAERDILDESRLLVSTDKMLDKLMPTDDSQNSIMESKAAAIHSHIFHIPVSSSKECDSIMESKAAAVSNELQPKGNTVSLNVISMADFEFSKKHSTHEQGTISGIKNDTDQQNSRMLADLDEARLVSEKMNQLSKGKGIHRNEIVAKLSNAQTVLVPGKLIAADHLANVAHDGQNINSKGQQLGTQTYIFDAQNGQHSSCKMQQMGSNCDPDLDVDVQIPSVSSSQVGQPQSSVQQQGNQPDSPHVQVSSADADSPKSQAHQFNPKSSRINLTGDCTSVEIVDKKEDAEVNPAVSPIDGSQLIDTVTLSNFVTNSIQQKAIATDDQFSSTMPKKAAVVLNQSKQIAEENTDLILCAKSSAMVTRGNIQTVKSYPIILYTYIEQKDHEVFSIFNGQNKPSVLANMKELVIKSNLWDQRRCDDEERWEEGSIGFSSAEEDQDEDDDYSLADLFSQEKNAIVIGTTKKRQEQYESSAMQIDKEALHTFEEGEEEEMLMQCRKNAARKGDLSPMHSKTNKKGRQRDRSWDGRVTEEGNIRRPPMRIAKLKQLTQRTNY